MKDSMVKTEGKKGQQDSNKVAVYKPKIDIIENEKNISIWADMPGVEKKDVDIELEGQELTLKASFNPEVIDKYTPCHSEYRSANYERKFTLGNEIDQSKIKASLKDGVLRLILTKAKEAQPKKIKINTA